jgi:hypothetical protein
MNCIKPNVRAKKYQPWTYNGYVVQPHPNAASSVIYGVRTPGERLMCAGPFAFWREAETWIDAHPIKEVV